MALPLITYLCIFNWVSSASSNNLRNRCSLTFEAHFGEFGTRLKTCRYISSEIEPLVKVDKILKTILFCFKQRRHKWHGGLQPREARPNPPLIGPVFIKIKLCFKLRISLLPRHSLSFWPLGTFNLLAMQICHPQEICKTHNQNPPNSTAVEIHDKLILDKVKIVIQDSSSNWSFLSITLYELLNSSLPHFRRVLILYMQ